MSAALAGAFLAAGLLLVLQGLFPKKPTLALRLAQFNDGSLDLQQGPKESLLQSYALQLLETVKGEKLERYESDLLVSGGDLPTAAVEKVQSAAIVGAGFGVVGVLIGAVSGPVGLFAALALGAVLGYSYSDFELKKKAAARRVEFAHTLTTYMTLLTSSISGGGGLTTALDDAVAMGDSWVFDHIRECLAAARLEGVSPWNALEQLGHRLQVVPLIELAGALTLAGASGARVTETLTSRAHSSRQKELSEVRAEAEAKSSKLGLPVGMIMMTWVIFIIFPAIQSLLGGI